MKVDIRGRQTGKTTALVEWAKAAPEGEVRAIVVMSEPARTAIHRKHPELAVYTAVEAHERLRGHGLASVTGRPIKLGVDDLDYTLPTLLGYPVERVVLCEAEPAEHYGPSPLVEAFRSHQATKMDASMFEAYRAHEERRMRDALGVGSPEQTLRTAADEMAKAMIELLISNGKNTSTPTFHGDVKVVELAKQALDDYEQAKAAMQRAKTEHPPAPPKPAPGAPWSEQVKGG